MSQRKLILSMQITLDGYIAGTNDQSDWLINEDDGWDDLFEDLDNADTFLLGRKMFPGYSEYWQSVLVQSDQSSNEYKFAKLADNTQHIVFTKNDFSPNWKNTRVAHDLEMEIDRLKKEPGKNIIAWGGGNFAASLIKHDLIDEYRLAINPTILTAGKSLFTHLAQRKTFTLIKAKALKSGLAILRYDRGTRG